MSAAARKTRYVPGDNAPLDVERAIAEHAGGVVPTRGVRSS